MLVMTSRRSQRQLGCLGHDARRASRAVGPGMSSVGRSRIVLDTHGRRPPPRESTRPFICYDHGMNVSVEDIEKDPRAYFHRVLEGETVVVFEKDNAVAEMRPLAKRAGKRPMGLAKGDFVVPDDFNDPLPEDVLQLFESE